MVLMLERAEGEKVEGLPRTVKVRQMLAAGWGGAGSVVESASIMAATSMAVAAVDLATVMRKSARMSPGRDAMMSYEHRDAFELPAFLRAKGGDAWASWPEAFVSRINELWARDGSLPAQLDAIADTVPDEILRELQALVTDRGLDEGTAIALLVRTLAEAGVMPAIERGVTRAARRAVQAVPAATFGSLARLCALSPQPAKSTNGGR